jgi:hypothetical protein
MYTRVMVAPRVVELVAISKVNEQSERVFGAVVVDLDLVVVYRDAR